MPPQTISHRMSSIPLPNEHLTHGRFLARNVFWNLAGNGAPLLAALVCVPLLIRSLGADRFGVLTLAWALVGYFSLFDMGLGRALTKLVAEKLGAGMDEDIPALLWTSLVLMGLFGIAGGAVLAGLSPVLVHHLLKIPSAIRHEALVAFYLLAAALPFVITTAGLRGFLEAQQLFDKISWIRLPLGLFTFAGPLLVLPFSKSLIPVVALLVAGRILAWIAYGWLCVRECRGVTSVAAYQTSAAALARFGMWMTVSNLISPLMAYLDRFLIGGMISVTAVAYYAIPYEMITKLLLIPGVIVGVIFPAFSTSLAQNRERVSLLSERATQYVALAMFPIVLVVVALAREGLGLWLGSDFAAHSASVLQWLAVGVFLNGLAQVPFAQLQGAGRLDLTAKLHFVELPLYVMTLSLLVYKKGIAGAAIAWAARVGVDAILMFYFAWRLLPGSSRAPRRVALITAIGLGCCAATACLPRVSLKLAFVAMIVTAFAVFTWRWWLSEVERTYVRRLGRTLEPTS